MFEIINKQILADGIKRLDIRAPNIAYKVQPGQFVNICPEEGEERIPLSVADADSQKGTISLIFQEVGATTIKLGKLQINDEIFSILGPLGIPATVDKKGIVVCIATGIGTAQILPISRALKKEGNKVIDKLSKNFRCQSLSLISTIFCGNINFIARYSQLGL